MDQFEKAAAEVQMARVELHACVVPSPERRTLVSAILRELAMSDESLSAKQIADLLDQRLRPPVAEIRAYLRAKEKTLFAQVRRAASCWGTTTSCLSPSTSVPEDHLHKREQANLIVQHRSGATRKALRPPRHRQQECT